MRTMGSGSVKPFRAKSTFEGETRGPSSVSALARAIAGAWRSAAIAASRGAASARPVHAACNPSA